MVRGPTALSGPDVVAWDDPTKRNAKLSPGGSVHDPTDPVGRLLFKVLAIRRLATGNARKSTLYHRRASRCRPVPEGWLGSRRVPPQCFGAVTIAEAIDSPTGSRFDPDSA